MQVFHVDAFADAPFTGNPAGVCLLDDEHDAGWMQDVAAELNLSATAFLVAGSAAWDLRWFTRTAELELCGHGTLASAHVLWETGHTADELTFRTRSGALRASRAGDAIRMDFPAEPVVAVDPPAELAGALGAAPVFVGRNRFDLLIELESPVTVRALAPDARALRALGGRVVIVTAAGDGGADFVSRCFAPSIGIDEDPVTGSAHCCLGPYWAGKLGRDRLHGFQASARGGWVGVEVLGDRVGLEGRAVTVLSGELLSRN